jgi:hypothetical protein
MAAAAAEAVAETSVAPLHINIQDIELDIG